MGKKDKKKGKGAEKTAAKTEKKALQKVKRELAAKGEDDIEMLIAESKVKDRQQSCFVGEERCEPPTPRSCFTICANPDKDELLIFGGEYFNGAKTAMYNDLYFYNIKKDQWSILQCSDKPTPRCSHQAVTLSHGGGQMWIFGGEFASPTRSNFHHYKDLWCYHISEKRWEQIKAPGGPSARSGHRMVLCRKRLLVFGGFYESVSDHKYFNDVHIFDLESYQWSKIEPSGRGPSPRSGCQMATLSDAKIMLYGGYSREKVKKDIEKGTAHTDMYCLQSDERLGVTKWKWVQVRQSGISPSPRSGFSIATAPGNRAFLFGGVQDMEDSEEELKGLPHNDMYALELENGRWFPISLHSKSENAERKRRRKVKAADGDDDDMEEEDLTISDARNLPQVEVKTSEDNVFTLRIETSSAAVNEGCSTSIMNVDEPSPFWPSPRMNAGIVVKHSVLYLYGGLYEDGDRQFTLSDFYSCDLHKLNEWRTIIASNAATSEWFESDESDDDEDDDDSSDTDEENQSDEMDTT